MKQSQEIPICHLLKMIVLVVLDISQMKSGVKGNFGVMKSLMILGFGLLNFNPGLNLLLGQNLRMHALNPNKRIEIALPLVGQGPQAAMRLSAPHACR